MFNPKQMSRLLIVASKEHLDPVIAELYRHHVFHIEDFVEGANEDIKGVKIGNPSKGADVLSTDLVRVRSIASTFEVKPDTVKGLQTMQNSEIRGRIQEDLPRIAKEVEELLSRRAHLDSSMKEYEQRIELLKPFVHSPVPIDMLSGYDSVSIIAGTYPGTLTLDVPHEEYKETLKGTTTTILAVKNSDLAEVEKKLLDASFHKIPIPEEEGSPQELIYRYEQEIAALQQSMDEISLNLADIKEKQKEFLLASEELLSADLEKAEAPLLFATTEHAFAIEGWVPAENKDALQEDIQKVTRGNVLLSELDIDDPNNGPPVEYNNPDFAHPTELFMDVYSRPRYTEVDPSLLMAIVYPIMFGLILGDVGYGLILLVLSFGLRSFLTGKAGKQLLDVLRNCSISSIFFGIVFSEFFGFSLPWHPLWLSRHLNIGASPEAHAVAEVSHIPELLVLSIWIGLLHITLGRLWGARNAAKMDHGHHRQLAIYANIGWVMVMWGIVFLIWSFFPIPFMIDLSGLPEIVSGLNAASIAGALILVVGIIFIARENVLDLMEIPTIISHVLSYTRLIAVGLSSVAIAMVTNYISIGMIIGPNFDLSVFGIIFLVVGIIVFLIGHTINTALGIIGGGLHPLRLHYVEFFTKFYRGGGKIYNPFGKDRKLTEIE